MTAHMEGENTQNQAKNGYISLGEASKLCSYSAKYLNLRANQGKLKALKIGNQWVTTKEWIEDYIKNYGWNGSTLQQDSPREPEGSSEPRTAGQASTLREQIGNEGSHTDTGYQKYVEPLYPERAKPDTIQYLAKRVEGPPELEKVIVAAPPTKTSPFHKPTLSLSKVLPVFAKTTGVFLMFFTMTFMALGSFQPALTCPECLEWAEEAQTHIDSLRPKIAGITDQMETVADAVLPLVPSSISKTVNENGPLVSSWTASLLDSFKINLPLLENVRSFARTLPLYPELVEGLSRFTDSLDSFSQALGLNADTLQNLLEESYVKSLQILVPGYQPPSYALKLAPRIVPRLQNLETVIREERIIREQAPGGERLIERIQEVEKITEVTKITEETSLVDLSRIDTDINTVNQDLRDLNTSLASLNLKILNLGITPSSPIPPSPAPSLPSSAFAINNILVDQITPNIVSSVEGVVNDGGNIDFVSGSSDLTITGSDAANTVTFSISLSGVNATLLDSLDSTDFLRATASSTLSSGILSIGSGTSLGIAGTLFWDLANDVTLSVTNPTGARTYTIPDFGSNDTFVGLASTQTLTNKTLATGTLLSATLDAQNNLFTNIGNAGTDFVSGGGLTLAGLFTSNATSTVNANFAVLGLTSTDSDFIYFDATTTEYLVWGDASSTFSFSDDLFLEAGGLTANATSTINGNLAVLGVSTTDSDFIYFDATTTEFLQWSNASDTFVLSDDLNLTNKLITNIGDVGTDFISGGGLTLAGAFTANGNVGITSAADADIQFNSSTVSSGPNSPTTVVNDASIGGLAWTSPSNALTSNDAVASITDPTTTQYLKATGFGFSIPSSATILGIVAEVEARQTGTALYGTFSVRLVKDGTITGNDHSSEVGNYSTIDTYYPFGTSADLWSATWTPTDINASNFGVVYAISCTSVFGIGCSPGDGSFFVDHIRITVTYSTTWSLGVDQSDSTKFKISSSNALGTSDAFTLTSTGLLNLVNTLTITGTSTNAFAATDSGITNALNVGTNTIASSGSFDIDMQSGSVISTLTVKNTTGTGDANITSHGTIKSILDGGDGDGFYTTDGDFLYFIVDSNGNETGDTMIFRENSIFGLSLIEASTSTVALNLTDSDQPERLCHSGADGATGLVNIGDCAVAGADIAEYFGSDGLLEPGDLAVLEGESQIVENARYGKLVKSFVKKSEHPYATRLLGVVSTNPDEILGARTFAPDEYPIPVALAGQVPVKVSTENGTIQPGDLLTSSSIPGIAMKATQPGPTVGKALESFSCESQEPCQGTIVLFVSLGYYVPPEDLQLPIFGSSTSEDSLIHRLTDQMIPRVLAGIGGTIRDGVLSLADLIVEKFQVFDLKVGSPERPAGITIFDETTGEPYCVKIKNSELLHETGECQIK